MKLKLKFWDTERKFMLESNVSCVTAFQNYLGQAACSGFSDCNFTPEKDRYIPLIKIGIDNKGNDLFIHDLVSVDLNNIYDKDLKVKCEIVYDEKECCFCVNPIENIEHLIPMPLFGIMSEIERIGCKYELF